MVRELVKHVLKKPTTLRYPFEKRDSFEGFRGRPIWDMKRCTGCELCYKVCPSEAIVMIGKGRKSEFKHNIGRCLFCAQCEEICPVNAIRMTDEYELASYDQDNMLRDFKREDSN